MRPMATRMGVSGASAGRSGRRTTSGSRSSRDQTLADHGGPRLGDALLQQPAQAPVVLHPVLELGVARVGRLEVDERRVELGVVLGVRRLRARDDREELPLVDEIRVAAQRRARPQVVRQLQAPDARPAACSSSPCRSTACDRARRRARGRAASPHVRLTKIMSSETTLVERRAARARNDRHPAVRRRLPVDVEAVVDARDVGLAAAGGLCLREPPQHAQLGAPLRIGRRRERRSRMRRRSRRGAGSPRPERDSPASRVERACRPASTSAYSESAGRAAPCRERERRDRGIGQHRDLAPRHVDGRQALARDRVERRAARNRRAPAPRCGCRSRDGRSRVRAPRTRRRSRSSCDRRSRTRARPRAAGPAVAGARRTRGNAMPFGNACARKPL